MLPGKLLPWTQVHRKLALKIVKKTDTGHALQPSELNDYVGKPVYNQTRLYDVTPPGVVVGLAWTSMGMRWTPLACC